MKAKLKPAAAVDESTVAETGNPVSEQMTRNLAGICNFTRVSGNHQQLLDNIASSYGPYSFRLVLTRGGWYRIGGLVDANGDHVTDNLYDWVEDECGGDLDELFEYHASRGYRVTHLHGKTHYIVAPTGEAPDEFIQIEVEEMHETMHNLLFDGDEIPDDIDELADPINYVAAEQQPVGMPRYSLRRVTHIASYLREHITASSKQASIRRFLDDWSRSSAAAEAGLFCEHWVLALREYIDEYGEEIMLSHPVCTFEGDIPLLQKELLKHGSRLANLIHGFDREVGYPMAWYFYMLTHKNVPFQLVEAIHHDQMGAYDYLPARDLKVLIDWYNKPYSL